MSFLCISGHFIQFAGKKISEKMQDLIKEWGLVKMGFLWIYHVISRKNITALPEGGGKVEFHV